MFTFADGLLLVAHVVLGALQSETHPALMALVLAGVAFVVGLQVLACAAGHGGGTFAHRVFIAMSQGRDREPMLIGWADTPPADRRFFLRAGVGLTTAAGLLGFGLAATGGQPGACQWHGAARGRLSDAGCAAGAYTALVKCSECRVCAA